MLLFQPSMPFSLDNGDKILFRPAIPIHMAQPAFDNVASNFDDESGIGDKEINLTTMQVFGVYLPGGGWNYGSSPIFSYDHESNQWTVPINFSFGKTIISNGRPWKLGMEINYYAENPDEFGPERMIGISIAPVVENALANWF